MTLSFYVGGDWEVVDAYHSVSFYRRTAEATFASPATVTSVLRQDITKEEMESRGLLKKAGVIWHLWQEKMPAGVTPKVHDVIQDAGGGRWTILQVGIMALSSRFECVTIKEV